MLGKQVLVGLYIENGTQEFYQTFPGSFLSIIPSSYYTMYISMVTAPFL